MIEFVNRGSSSNRSGGHLQQVMGSLFICYEAIDPLSLKNRVQSLMLLGTSGDANKQPIQAGLQYLTSQSVGELFIKQSTILIQNSTEQFRTSSLFEDFAIPQ